MRKNYGNKLVKQVIVMATASMLTMSPVITVMAEETAAASVESNEASNNSGTPEEESKNTETSDNKSTNNDSKESETTDSKSTNNDSKESETTDSKSTNNDSKESETTDSKSTNNESIENESINQNSFFNDESSKTNQGNDDNLKNINDSEEVNDGNNQESESNDEIALLSLENDLLDNTTSDADQNDFSEDEVVKEITELCNTVISNSDDVNSAMSNAKEYEENAKDYLEDELKESQKKAEEYAAKVEEEAKKVEKEVKKAEASYNAAKIAYEEAEKIYNDADAEVKNAIKEYNKYVDIYQIKNENGDLAYQRYYTDVLKYDVGEHLTTDTVDLENKDAVMLEQAQNVQNAVSIYVTAVDELTQAGQNVEAAELKYKSMEEAAEALGEETKKIQNDLDRLKVIKDKLDNAYNKKESAKLDYLATKKYSDDAKNYRDWAEALTNVDKFKFDAFAQKNKDGKVVYANELGFDVDNKNVISQSTKYFNKVSEQVTLKIPYSIYQDYVRRMYSEFKYSDVKNPNDAENNPANGKGISFTDQTANNTVVYWEIDDNMQLTGKWYTDFDEMVDGKTYFLGYSFKCQLAEQKYHLDGYYYVYNADKKEEPDLGTDEPTPNPGNGNNGSSSGKDKKSSSSKSNSANVTVINDDATPLADTMPLVSITDDVTPLSVNFIDEENVALTDSIPQTGDTSVPFAPYTAAGTAAIGVAYLVSAMKKRK